MSRVLPALWLAAFVSTPAWAVPITTPELGTYGAIATNSSSDVADLSDIGRAALPIGGGPVLDGYADIALGDPSANVNNGSTFVFFGPGPGYNAAQLRINGTNAQKFGFAVDGIGDLNNDGFEDLVIGAPATNLVAGANAGAVYVFYGPLTGGVRPAASASAIIMGQAPGDMAGSSVQIVRDMTGDGVDDLLIGAPGVATGALGGGAVYIVAGNAPMPATLGAAGVTKLFSVTPGAALGTSVDGVLDYDGDGTGDAIAGAPGNSAAHIISGAGVAWGAAANIAPVSMKIDGAGIPSFGRSVSVVGDLDGDGRDEVIIGAPADYAGWGAVYLTGDSLAPYVPFTAPAAAGVSFWYKGAFAGGNLGLDVSEAGDSTLDGVPEFAASAPRALAGNTYVKPGPLVYPVPGFMGLITAGPAPLVIVPAAPFNNVGGALDGSNDDDADGIPDVLVGARDNGLIPHNTAGSF